MEYCQRAGPSLTHVPTVAHILCQRILKILPDRRARDAESACGAANSVGGRDLGDYFDGLGDSIVTVRTLGKRRSGTPMPVPTREFVGPWDSNPQLTDYKSGCLQGEA